MISHYYVHVINIICGSFGAKPGGSQSTFSFNHSRESSQTTNPAVTSEEDTHPKLFNNEQEAAFRKELHYCTGEFDFMATGKKRGKVAHFS